MRTRIPAIARKELLHVVRDWRTLVIAFVLPVVLILLFGYGITFDIRNLKLAVVDEDRTEAARDLIERFTASEYFDLVAVRENPADLFGLLDVGEAQIGMVVPRDYARGLERGEPEAVQFLVDGSESNTATIAGNYVDTIVGTLNLRLVGDRMRVRGLPSGGIPPVDPDVRVWFNPELDSTNTIVPGLIATIMVIIAALLTSLTVVREREFGSLEGLIATPARKHEILLGKMLPYLGITLIDCLLLALVGAWVFGVPFEGSIVLFAGTALVFAVAGLSIGLLASVVAGNQLLRNQIVVLTTLLPSMLLSGFMFPIRSMPAWVQAITYAVPARYFVTLCRSILLKAAPPADLLKPTLFLIAFGAALLVLSIRRFHKKL